jgi:hypothetical protein
VPSRLLRPHRPPPSRTTANRLLGTSSVRFISSTPLVLSFPPFTSCHLTASTTSVSRSPSSPQANLMSLLSLLFLFVPLRLATSLDSTANQPTRSVRASFPSLSPFAVVPSIQGAAGRPRVELERVSGPQLSRWAASSRGSGTYDGEATVGAEEQDRAENSTEESKSRRRKRRGLRQQQPLTSHAPLQSITNSPILLSAGLQLSTTPKRRSPAPPSTSLSPGADDSCFPG